MIAVLASEAGLARAADEWKEATEVWLAGVDGAVNDKGLIMPGLGDVGDRLFMTIGREK